MRLRETGFRLRPEMGRTARRWQPYMRRLGRDENRNELIFDDVLQALEAGRSPVVLTERRDTWSRLQARFKGFVRNLVVLRGGMAASERRKPKQDARC